MVKKQIIHKKGKITHHFHDKMSDYVIIHDNTLVVEKIQKKLDCSHKIENKRYLMYTGKYKNKDITVIATGMGAGNTALVVDQIIDQGAKFILKIGTFGSMKDEIKIGDIFLPNGAVRTDGVTEAYAPIEYPASPDMILLDEIKTTADKLKIKYNYGFIWTVNVYQPVTKDTSINYKYKFDTWKPLDVAGVEMEVAATFVCSSVKKAKSAAILICNREWKVLDDFRKGKKVDWGKHKNQSLMNKQIDKAIVLALETINNLQS